MKCLIVVAALVLLCSCSAATELLSGPVELAAVTNVETPPATAETTYPREVVDRGRYLVELLACGSCHSNGALMGAPDPAQLLAGSDIGIAWSNPLIDDNPGIVYPANLTPDMETGLGTWTLNDIVAMLRSGIERHSGQPLPVIPWPVYSRIAPNDATAIAAYLLSIRPVRHEVPDNVLPGQRHSAPYVYFGVYQVR